MTTPNKQHDEVQNKPPKASQRLPEEFDNEEFTPYVREFKNETLFFRVPSSTAYKFNSQVNGSGLSRSDALRFILNDWIRSGKELPGRL